jgi:glutathione-regulated potassium-efflux system protein KefB
LVAGILVGAIRDIPTGSVAALREFAELGVVLLLFLIGLEITPPQLRRLGRDAAVLGIPQIIATALVIGVYVWLVFGRWESAILLGLGFSLSSTIVVVQTLQDRGELHLPWGRKAFAILLAQDMAIVPFLLVVTLLATRDSGGYGSTGWFWAVLRASIAMVGIVAAGRFVLTRVLAMATRQRNEPAFACVTFLGVLTAALASESVGLSMALGTFLLGATLSMSEFGHRIAAIVEPVKSTMLPLFFLSIGLSIDLEVVSQSWVLLSVNTVVVLALKFGVILALVLTVGLPMSDGLRLSLALAQCGEFGFVLFSAAQTAGLTTPEKAALANVVITISMLATPFLVRLGDRLTTAALVERRSS